MVFWILCRVRFQSTLPSRGATVEIKVNVYDEMISIHAPLAGSDYNTPLYVRYGLFQSTLPSRGATGPGGLQHSPLLISIHAPLAGSDSASVM